MKTAFLAVLMQAAAALANPLPQGLLRGQGMYSVWGIEVYEARLWALPDFDAKAYWRHPLALELNYRRDFKSADIVRRSIVEMRRQAASPAPQEALWSQALSQVLPDVSKGDRIAAVLQPGQDLAFWVNDRQVGRISDETLIRLFLGIWLAEQSSAPRLRTQLITPAPSAPQGGP